MKADLVVPGVELWYPARAGGKSHSDPDKIGVHIDFDHNQLGLPVETDGSLSRISARADLMFMLGHEAGHFYLFEFSDVRLNPTEIEQVCDALAVLTLLVDAHSAAGPRDHADKWTTRAKGIGRLSDAMASGPAHRRHVPRSACTTAFHSDWRGLQNQEKRHTGRTGSTYPGTCT